MASRQTLRQWCIENNKSVFLNEWDYEKNAENGLTPDNVGCKSSKYCVRWICPRGHSYEAYVGNRTRRNDGCPYCSDHKLLKGFNDLSFIVPEICSEWDEDRNREEHEKDVANGVKEPHPATPQDILWGSSKKVYWKCKFGHMFKASPNSRHTTREGFFAMCNRCADNNRSLARKKKRAKKNNLALQLPQAAEEWVSSENGLTPEQVSCHSKEMVHWRCRKGHEFDKRITDRVYQKDGMLFFHQCGECLRHTKTSIPEQLIYFYVKKVFPDTVNTYIKLGVELDVFIPSRRIAIEYDGSYTHKNRIDRDNKKDDICASKDVAFYRFRAKALPNTKSAKRITVDETNVGVIDGLKTFFHDIGVSAPEMDIDKDYDDILSIFHERVMTSVASTWLISEWDYNQNSLDPNFISAKETKIKVHWICPLCHASYESYPYNRYVRKTEHPYCPNKKSLRRNVRRVKNVDTDEIFDCISDAEKVYGKAGNTSISCCCRGRYKTAYGYHWQYVDEYAGEDTPVI